MGKINDLPSYKKVNGKPLTSFLKKKDHTSNAVGKMGHEKPCLILGKSRQELMSLTKCVIWWKMCDILGSVLSSTGCVTCIGRLNRSGCCLSLDGYHMM